MKTVTLQTLLEKLNLRIKNSERQDIVSTGITGITADSRKVKPGYLFIALKGTASDGHKYLKSVEKKGAVAALVEEINPKLGLYQIKVESTRELWGPCLSIFYDFPENKLKFIGLTGTNGKTTTSYILEKMLKSSGFEVGIIGTIEYRYKDVSIMAPFTSPDPEILYPILSDMVNKGVEIVIMEVSSHALAQERVRGLKFSAALLTNFTQDHLDFHKTMEEYASAKKLLFTKYLKNDATIAAWHDNEHIDDIIPSSLKKITYSLKNNSKANFKCNSHELHIDGVRAEIESHGSPRLLHLESELIGEHNILNIMGAFILASHFGVESQKALTSVKNITVPGRLARVQGDIPVFVDYAHTPDALDRAQMALKPLVQGRLITVFGCGGDRDKQKRPLMGKSVDVNSDIAFVTSDNPRTEDPIEIINEILPGMQSPIYTTNEIKTKTKGCVVLPNRGEAIREAILICKPGDTVLIAGKGHEDYQILGTVKHHFDDSEEAKSSLELWSKGNEDQH